MSGCVYSSTHGCIRCPDDTAVQQQHSGTPTCNVNQPENADMLHLVKAADEAVQLPNFSAMVPARLRYVQ